MTDPPLTLLVESADSGVARQLIRELDADLLQRYPNQWIHGLHPDDVLDPGLIFVVARAGTRAVGCGALRKLGPGMAEVKRMFIAPGFRGRGYSRMILTFLESKARSSGYLTLRLETGKKQPEAIGLYVSAGYREIPSYGEYVGNPFSVCFEKVLQEGTPASHDGHPA
jgi:GNAT superfamily N-acetyltransferase